MNVLVACHCEEPVVMSTPPSMENELYVFSPKLFLIKYPFKNIVYKEIKDVEIYYVEIDEYCKSYDSKYQYKGWENIPDGFFDLIWFQYCPIYEYTRDKTTGEHTNIIFYNILKSSLPKLKPTGKILVPHITNKKITRHFIKSNFPDVKHKFITDDNYEEIPYFFVEMKHHENEDITDYYDDYVDEIFNVIIDTESSMLIIQNKIPKGGKTAKLQKNLRKKRSMKTNRKKYT